MKNIIVILFLLLSSIACTSTRIIVPISDPTPPTASLSIDFTTLEGQRMTVDLSRSSLPYSYDLDPREPVSFLAGGSDSDGGIKKITINISYSRTLFNDDTFNESFVEFNSTDASPGEEASTSLVKSWVFIPTEATINSGKRFAKITGTVFAVAENFHGGTEITQLFRFTHCMRQGFQGGYMLCNNDGTFIY